MKPWLTRRSAVEVVAEVVVARGSGASPTRAERAPDQGINAGSPQMNLVRHCDGNEPGFRSIIIRVLGRIQPTFVFRDFGVRIDSTTPLSSPAPHGVGSRGKKPFRDTLTKCGHPCQWGARRSRLTRVYSWAG